MTGAQLETEWWESPKIRESYDGSQYMTLENHYPPRKPNEIWDSENRLVGLHPIMTAENIQYQPKYRTIEENLLKNTVDGLTSGLEYAEMALLDHDTKLGRTTRKNKMWAEQMEKDIFQIKLTIKTIKETCGFNL